MHVQPAPSKVITGYFPKSLAFAPIERVSIALTAGELGYLWTEFPEFENTRNIVAAEASPSRLARVEVVIAEPLPLEVLAIPLRVWVLIYKYPGLRSASYEATMRREPSLRCFQVREILDLG